MYIDSHAHLTSSQVPKEHLEGILTRAQQCRISKIVNICTDERSLEEGLALHGRYPWVYNAAATTPHDVEQEGASFFPIVTEAARVGKLIAIGETGLDYHYAHSPRSLQQEYLVRYFALARAVGLPLIFHCREAFDDLFALADVHYAGSSGLLHCFTGTFSEAKRVVDRGWYLSISGIVTFKKSEELRQMIKKLPLDQMLVETDMPYLAPQSKRGQPNESSYLVETVACLAELLGKSKGELAEITARNAEKFFSFSKLKSDV